MKQSDRIIIVVSELAAWYARHKRELPWRDLTIKSDTERAYRILISEIMLQQTQVERVKIVFRNFLESFPSLQDLARANNREILMAWRGMGYNSRALRLRDAARKICDNGRGMARHAPTGKIIFPTEIENLRAIPGIGHYTAAAIRNFAFGLPTPGIDTNIRRVLHRTFIGPENPDGTFPTDDKKLLTLCGEVLAEWMKQGYRAQDFFAAMMDYGSMVQTKRNPKWDVCVLSKKGIMKTNGKNFKSVGATSDVAPTAKQEPGRYVGSKFIPNRIFRGKIVEALRDHPSGLSVDQLGKQTCIDWDESLNPWIKKLITKLVQDGMISPKKGKYTLAD